MHHARRLHSNALLCLLTVGTLASCRDDAPQAAAAPGTSTPTAAQAADASPGRRLHAEFVSGTGYATTGDRAELVLHARDQRIGDVLERLASLSGVPLEIAPDARIDLDRQVTMNFDRVPLRTVLELIAQESSTPIAADTDAIRVQAGAAPAG